MNRFVPMLAAALAAATASAQAVPASGVLLDSYAALVNGKVITVGEVLSALQPAQARLASQYDGVELEQKILDEYAATRDALIESELILMDFEMQGGSLPDRAVEDHINTVIHDRFGNDRAAFLKALAAERLTFAEWRRQMKDQLVVQIMRQKEVSAKILIAPLDIQRAYDQKRDAYALPERIRLRTLALPLGADDPARQQTRDRARELRDRILAGEVPFDKATSDDATLQDDADWIETGSLGAPIRDALRPLSPGGLSEPVEIDGSLYLVQLVDHQPARIRSVEEVAPQIEKELRKAEFTRLNRIWIDSLRSKYYIQTFTHALFE